MNRNQLLYVENISPSSSEEHLITYLEKWAPVLQVYFLREKQCTKRSIAAFVRVASEADLDMLLSRNQQNYRGKRLFMIRVDQTQFFQADHTIIVRNITSKISEENLYDHFEECGQIAFLQIRTDDFAYIGFEDKSSVRLAMGKNNLPLKGSNLKIQLLTRNIEIMIVNLDTLKSRMPELYRKMIQPVEPRQRSAEQQQQQQQQPEPEQAENQQKFSQQGNQQKQYDPPKQQEPSKPKQQESQQHNQRNQQQQRQQQQQQHSQPASQQQQFGNQQRQENQKQQQQQQQPQRYGNQQQQQQQPTRQQQPNRHQESGNQYSKSSSQPQQSYQSSQNQQQQQQQQQQRGQPQQQSQPQRPPQQQPQPQRLPQQQPQPQRPPQQQPQPQRQQLTSIQLLKEKANSFAEKQAPVVQPVQEKPAAPVATPVDPQVTIVDLDPVEASEPIASVAPTVEDTDDVQIIEPIKPTEMVVDSDPEIADADTFVVPPIPSAYKPQPNDIMRPVKASEIPMSVVQNIKKNDSRSVWVNNIAPEVSRMNLVLYMEQFGDVEKCKIGTSKNCYLTRWAKVCFTSEKAALKATEYFLHPFLGRYLFVLACNRCIDEIPERVFMLDYLSKYHVYEDVAKCFKHAGDVFYLVRVAGNSHKVRIFFLNPVNAKAVLAVKSIGGISINVEPYRKDNLTLTYDQMCQLRNSRDILDPQKEARLTKILEIYKKEELARCDAIINPEGNSEGIIVSVTNVHNSTTVQQINEFFEPVVGKPVFARREADTTSAGFQRVIVGFRTLSLVLKACELPADKYLNGYKPFIFPAWTKPLMTEHNTLKIIFIENKDIVIQDIYEKLREFGKIRYIEKSARVALVVFESNEALLSCKIPPGSFIGKAGVVRTEFYRQSKVHYKLKKKGIFNIESKRMLRERKQKITKQELQAMKSDAREEKKVLSADMVVMKGMEQALAKARINNQKNASLQSEPAAGAAQTTRAAAPNPPPQADKPQSQQQQQPPVVTQDGETTTKILLRPTFIAGTWNVSACAKKTEQELVDQFLHTQSVSVAALQDTRLQTCTFETSNYHWYNINKEPGQLGMEGGSALLVRRDLLPSCKFERISDGVCAVRLPIFEETFTFVAVYARSSGEQVDPAIRSAHHYINRLSAAERENLALIGDFNAHVGTNDLQKAYSNSVGKFLIHPLSNANGNALKDILHCFKLRLCSSYGPCGSVMSTLIRGDDKAQVSHVLMPIIKRFFRPTCRCVVEPTDFSDHNLLLLTLKHNSDPEKKQRKPRMRAKDYAKPIQVQQKKPAEAIVIDDEDDVVEVAPSKSSKPTQNNGQPNAKNPVPQRNAQNNKQQQQQRQHQQQRSGPDRNRNPFAGNNSPQRQHPYQRRSMNQWAEQQQQQLQQFQRQFNQFGPGGDRNMQNNDMFDQFGNFAGNYQGDPNFGPLDSCDPPLDRRWGNQQQQYPNRFSPPRQQSPFGRRFNDDRGDDNLDFGRDSPGIPPNIPDDEIDEYILRKQEAIKRRLEQLDKQLITSVEGSRHFEHDQRRQRRGTIFGDNGDVHYVPNPAAVARNRDRRSGRVRGRGNGNEEAGRAPWKNQERRNSRDRNRRGQRSRDPFADVDIVPIIRISEDRSPSPKRNREDAFDPAQFDAAWS